MKPKLVKVYCAKAARSEWRRRDRNASHTHSKIGLVYAELLMYAVSGPTGEAICLGCNKKIKVVLR